MNRQEANRQMAMEARLRALAKDSVYALEAFEFIYFGLQRAMKEPGVHVSGEDLCIALKQGGVDLFGYMAKTVFNQWGVHTTADWGKIVFTLVDAEMLGKQDSDEQHEFENVYDFEELELKFQFKGD